MLLFSLWVWLFATPWLYPTRSLCPWHFPDENTGVGCHCLHQGIFPTQGLNLCLLHWQLDSLPSEPPWKQTLRRVCVCMCVLNRSVTSDSLQLLDCNFPGSSVHGNSPGKNTGVDCHALLQGTFPTQGSNSDTLPSESPEGLDLTRRLNFSTVRVALYSVPCTICFSPSLQSDFPLLPPFFPSIHISHTFGRNSLNRSAHQWVCTVFHSFSKVRVFLNTFAVVYLTNDMFQLTITWFVFFLRCQLQTVKYTHPKYVGWKVLI